MSVRARRGGWRDDTDHGGCISGGRNVAPRNGASAIRSAFVSDGAGCHAGERDAGTAPPRDPAAGLSEPELLLGRRGLPARGSPAECGAGVQRDQCAGVPAERHRDRAADELLLAPLSPPEPVVALQKRQQTETWIGAAAVILVLVCTIPIRSSSAQGAPHQARSASPASDVTARRRHLHHAYDRDAGRPSYYGRPTYYAP